MRETFFDEQNIMLEWEQPGITDFDYFNIYWSTNGGATYSKLDSTIGVQYFLSVPSNGLYLFYVTTVDRAGQESVPSNIVQTNVFIGIQKPGQTDDISLIKMGPNPFAEKIMIDFKVTFDTKLKVRIFDILGNQVNTLYDSKIATGRHSVAWHGDDAAGNLLPAGIYLVQFATSKGIRVSFKAVIKR